MTSEQIRKILETRPIADGKVAMALSVAMRELDGSTMEERRTSPFSIIKLTDGLPNKEELRRLWKELNDKPAGTP